MPKINVVNKERVLEVNTGSNLRNVLIESGISPYKGLTKVLNCGGHGKCGKCDVEILDSENNRISIVHSCATSVNTDLRINVTPTK